VTELIFFVSSKEKCSLTLRDTVIIRSRVHMWTTCRNPPLETIPFIYNKEIRAVKRIDARRDHNWISRCSESLHPPFNDLRGWNNEAAVHSVWSALDRSCNSNAELTVQPSRSNQAPQRGGAAHAPRVACRYPRLRVLEIQVSEKRNQNKASLDCLYSHGPLDLLVF